MRGGRGGGRLREPQGRHWGGAASLPQPPLRKRCKTYWFWLPPPPDLPLLRGGGPPLVLILRDGARTWIHRQQESITLLVFVLWVPPPQT